MFFPISIAGKIFCCVGALWSGQAHWNGCWEWWTLGLAHHLLIIWGATTGCSRNTIMPTKNCLQLCHTPLIGDVRTDVSLQICPLTESGMDTFVFAWESMVTFQHKQTHIRMCVCMCMYLYIVSMHTMASFCTLASYNGRCPLHRLANSRTTGFI